MLPLPVDGLLPGILSALRMHHCLVLEAPPGAGKTTRVPPALLNLTKQEVWVLEPRRMAARMAARRVASERKEPLGETVGYQVRFEQVGGPRTRLRYLTEGVLTRRILSDPQLRHTGIVVLDEFHERHLDTDLALALLLRLQRTSRTDLKLIVMSATLDAAPIAGFLGGCPVIRSEGRLFPMQIRYRPHDASPLEDQVARAVESLDANGDTLVFLPGAVEIQRASRALESIATRRGLMVVPLHGDLSAEQQDMAVQPGPRRKVILSTNVAESSITIDGVTAVIDSGLARVASHSPWSGLPVLAVRRISQASAMQRAGRSARTAPGTVIRLYPEEDFLLRPPRDVPEILRQDLAEMLLSLQAAGVNSFNDLAWLDHPPAAHVEAALTLLNRLGANDSAGKLTRTGVAMSQCPLSPRLARLVVDANHRGVGEAGALAAALLSAGARLPREVRHATPSDVFALMEQDLPPMARRLAASIRQSMLIARGGKQDDDALLQSILAAFPDRVAKRRQGNELLLAGGGSAVLSPSSTIRDAQFLVAIDIEERQERGLPLVRLASAIEPAWLLDAAPERIEERSGVEWHRTGQRVESVNALVYEGIIIDESRGGRIDESKAAELLSAKAREAGLERFTNLDELRTFRARVRFAAQHSKIPALSDDAVLDALTGLCAGKRSFADLDAECRDGGFLRHLENYLGPDGRRLLEEIAPTRLRMPSGRQGRIEYAEGQAPRLSARLQEFFGMTETPRVARGAVPLVVLLLAPNMRPVQTTTDLAGFWTNWYPKIRKELMRKYPKHAWPEVPK